MCEAFRETFERLTKNGHEVKLFVLDNECSNDLKKAITSADKQYKLVPPHQHHRNATERAIWTEEKILKWISHV